MITLPDWSCPLYIFFCTGCIKVVRDCKDVSIHRKYSWLSNWGFSVNLNASGFNNDSSYTKCDLWCQDPPQLYSDSKVSYIGDLEHK